MIVNAVNLGKLHGTGGTIGIFIMLISRQV